MSRIENEVKEQKEIFQKAAMQRINEEYKKKFESDDPISVRIFNYAVGLTLAFIALAITATFNGWALSLLWYWFVAYPFGLKALSIAQGYGIIMIVHFIRLVILKQGFGEQEAENPSFIDHVITTLIMLSVGYLIFTFFIL